MKQLREQTYEHAEPSDAPVETHDNAYLMQRFQWFVDSSSLCGEVPMRFDMADTTPVRGRVSS